MDRRDASLELPFTTGLSRSESAAPSTATSQGQARSPSPAGAPAAAAEARRREARPLSVAELDRRLRRVVEQATMDVEVEGEIAGLRAVSSGHAYFALKDEREEACIDCVMYRTAPPRSRKLLVDGARVVLVGRATVYVPRGRLQFTADLARPAGRGALLEALEQLKEKLAAEGLFAAARKRPLPVDPKVIGVVTSGDGAAIHDIVKVAFRRGPVRILLARAPVQGAGAPQRIARAIVMLARAPEVEAIIVGRGGGSAEDLAAYNDEVVVRRVAASRVPIVSAVGHETDVSLTDLAADARASTPSQAAELLVPDERARRAVMTNLETRMRRAIAHRLRLERGALERHRGLAAAHRRLIADRQQRVDELVVRLRAAVLTALRRRKTVLSSCERRLASAHPRAVLAAARAALGPLEVRLAAAMRRGVERRRRTLANRAEKLDALSPLAVLARGYAIATTTDGRAVRDAREVAAGDDVLVRVHAGSFSARVTETVEPDNDDLMPERG